MLASLALQLEQASSASIAQRAQRDTPLLTLVIPTFNERVNLAELVRRVDLAMGEVRWEMVIVDDNSPDGTAKAAKAIARKDRRVRCLRRVGRRGLAGACIEGMLSSAAPYVAVMDGDLQHDESILPKMLEALRTGQVDLVVGSRHVEGGSSGEGFSATRAAISRFATRLSRLALKTEVGDVMSGFFMLRRDIVEDAAPHLCASGFKILADILASSREPLKTQEIPYEFRRRVAGESKLDLKIALDFLGLLINKATGGAVPVGFIFFGLVGFAGVAVHMGALSAALAAGVAFGTAQLGATLVAMTSNFFVNNMTTYRSAKLRGWRMLAGLAAFCGVCSLGAISNVGVAMWLFEMQQPWWLAALAGVVMGAVWNYSLSSLFVWRKAA